MKLNLNAIARTLCVLALGVGSATLSDVANAAEAQKKAKSTQVKKVVKKEVKKSKLAATKTTKVIKEVAKPVKGGKDTKVVTKKVKTVTTVEKKKKVASATVANYRPSNIKYSVFNYKTGEVLEESDSNIVWPIASLTKLMTAYVFVTNTPDLKNCTTSITEADKDLIKNTHTRLSANKSYDCRELLHVMLLASDNYAASAFARSVPGWSKADFVKKMNAQAKEWGLTNTRFVDSSGLSPENHSSVDDYRKLTMNVVKNHEISKISSQHQIVAENKWNKPITYRNSNMLVRELGLNVNLSKTGYIRESGYNLVHLGDCPANIGVVEFNASSTNQRAYFVKQKLAKYGCI
jgi:D-alanyl-D-alanine endopeptidase (penicillin-binding protein 7)